MRSEEDSITFHHGLIDPTDYQVDDVLLCVQPRDGLNVGSRYVAHEVTRCKAGGIVVTTVKVEKEGQIIEVPNADLFLIRTQVWVDFRMRDGRLVRHSFPSLECLGAWCAATGVPEEAIHQVRYVRARPVPHMVRFAAMCVPSRATGELEWYVHDLTQRTSDRIPLGLDSQVAAIELARESNRVWRAINKDQN